MPTPRQVQHNAGVHVHMHVARNVPVIRFAARTNLCRYQLLEVANRVIWTAPHTNPARGKHALARQRTSQRHPHTAAHILRFEPTGGAASAAAGGERGNYKRTHNTSP